MDKENLELWKLIVDEVDEAREVYEIVGQLAQALPIKTFIDIAKACGDRGTIRFRGNEFEITQFGNIVPATLFPIEDKQTLVALVYQAVKMAPKTHQYSDADPVNAKRRLRRLGLFGMPTGLLGPVPGPALSGRMGNLELKREREG